MSALSSLLSIALLAAATDRDVNSIEDISLDELLGSDTTVSSSKTTRLRDSPGIVTVITREDILRVGARDLSDLLVLVPGFDLHVEVQGTMGGTFRGLYAADGRSLVLVDGIEMNDTAFGAAYIFAHHPLDDVERIEILRGPGSARFGGFASLTVIQITTRGQRARNDVGGAVTYGQAAVAAPLQDQAASFMGGKTLDVAGGLQLSWNLHAGVRPQSRRTYVDVEGGSVSLDGRSTARSLWLETSARLPWLQARLIVDGYQQENATAYGIAQERPGEVNFPAVFLDLQAPLSPTSTFTITPRLFYTRQLPWRPTKPDDFVDVPDFRVLNDRLRLSMQATFDALPGALSFSAGVEGTVDNAGLPADGDRDLDWARLELDGDTKRYFNGALYGEALLETPIFRLTVGARSEAHSIYGPSFVPRVALTRAFDGAHAKLMVAGSFRSPALDNIRFAADEIRPERTRVIEAEGGVGLSESLYLTITAFDIFIHDPITYFVADNIDGYDNFSQTGTRGVEASLLGTAPFGRLELNYSFATTDGQNEVPLYAVPGDDSRLLAAPQHKGVLITSLFLAPGVTVTTTAVARSERASLVGLDADGGNVFGELPPSLMLNAALRIANVWPKGVEATIGVRNLLDHDFRIAQPYSSGHAPLPFDDREIYVRFAGELDL